MSRAPVASPFLADDGRTVIVALDHALTSGHVAGLDRPVRLLADLAAAGADAAIVAPGSARLARRTTPDLPLLLTVDYYGTSTIPGEGAGLEQHAVLFSPAHAHALGASGLKCLWVHGRRDPDAQLTAIRATARLLDEARDIELPVMVEAVLWGGALAPDREHEGKLVAHAARMAFELGADLIKVALPDDVAPLADVAAAIPVPIVVMGGPVVDPLDLFGRLRTVLDAGVRGVALGRNVWAATDPTVMVGALRKLVHDGAGVDAAWAHLNGEIRA